MLKKLTLGILLLITIFAPLSGIWDSISGTTKVDNDTELVKFINRHGDRGKSFTQIEIDHDSNMSPTAMRLVLTPKGRFAVLKDGLLTGLVTGIGFVGLVYFWRADFSKKES